MRELYGSESLTQVMLFLVDMFVGQRVTPPTVLGYDDGWATLHPRSPSSGSRSYPAAPPLHRCHLLKYAQCRRREGSKFATWLLEAMKIVVDRSTRGPASPPPWPRSHLHNRHHRRPPARRFHFPNHVDTKFCAKYVDPSKCPELGPRTNTEAAEQACRVALAPR